MAKSAHSLSLHASGRRAEERAKKRNSFSREVPDDDE
jgi:hypothetical protein